MKKLLYIVLLLSLAQAYELKIGVYDLQGNPVENATVVCYNETMSFKNFTNEQGSAIFELPEGCYFVNSTFELAFNSTEICLSNDEELSLVLQARTLGIFVLNASGTPLSNAVVKASANGISVVKETNESGFVSFNTSFEEVNVAISKEGYVAKSLAVNLTEISELSVVLPQKKVTFYLGTEENYETLKEIENETELVEVFRVGEEVDFANKSLVFFANVDESFCENLRKKVLVASFRSCGYSDENISRYWVYGGKENLVNLVNYLLAKFFGEEVSFEAPKLPEDRAKIIFILDKDLKQVPLLETARKDLYVEKNLNVTVLSYSSHEDLAESLKNLNLEEYSVVFLYMLSYPAQDVLKDYLLPLKEKIKIVGLGFTDVHGITNVDLKRSMQT